MGRDAVACAVTAALVCALQPSLRAGVLELPVDILDRTVCFLDPKHAPAMSQPIIKSRRK
eukprot:gene787-2463_t